MLAFEGITDAGTVAGAPHAWIRIGQSRRMFKLLRRHGVEEVVAVGTMRRMSLWRLRPDLLMIRGLLRLMFRFGFMLSRLGDDLTLKVLVTEFEHYGPRVVGIETVMRSLLATPGPYGALKPNAKAVRDIALGIEAAREVGARDVGQGAIVRDGQVLEIEDEHGTDAMLARCARHLRDGPGGVPIPNGVLVKVTKPGQQRKVDLPTIGVDTLIGAQRAGLAGIAVEAGGALVVDRAGVIEAADRAGLFVVGIEVGD